MSAQYTLSDIVYSHITVHLHVPTTCALYDAPEDGCIWHPKHVERGKCNKVTLNNLHQAGLNKPVHSLKLLYKYIATGRRNLGRSR